MSLSPHGEVSIAWRWSHLAREWFEANVELLDESKIKKDRTDGANGIASQSPVLDADYSTTGDPYFKFDVQKQPYNFWVYSNDLNAETKINLNSGQKSVFFNGQTSEKRGTLSSARIFWMPWSEYQTEVFGIQREERARKRKVNKKLSNLLKSTLRVPVAQFGWKVVHCFSLVFGYITASKNLLICENQNMTYSSQMCYRIIVFDMKKLL